MEERGRLWQPKAKCVCLSMSECVHLPVLIFVLKPVFNYRAGFLIDSRLLHLQAP